MNKLALAAATVAALAFSAPAFAASAAPDRIQLAQADVKVKIKSGDEGVTRKKVIVRHGGDVTRKKVVIRHGGDFTRKKVVIHRDRGRHEGWRHRNTGMNKTVIIKKRGGEGSKTIIKKKFEG